MDVVDGDSEERKLDISTDVDKLKEVEWVGTDSEENEFQEKVETDRLKVSDLFVSDLKYETIVSKTAVSSIKKEIYNQKNDNNKNN